MALATTGDTLGRSHGLVVSTRQTGLFLDQFQDGKLCDLLCANSSLGSSGEALFQNYPGNCMLRFTRWL